MAKGETTGAEVFGGLVIAFAWVAGLVLAKGFWSTLLAILVPPWGWYLIVERLLKMWGVL